MNVYKTLFTSILVFLCTAVSAQYNTLSEWYVGPSAGVTMSTITLVPKLVDKLYSIGKTAGFSTRYISEKHYGFQMDLQYFEAGWKEDYNGTGNSSDFSYSRKVNFVEMPLLMHTYTTAGPARFFINLGPKFSYLLSEKEVNLSPVAYPEHGKLIEHPFQYGLLGGGGLEIHFKRSVIGLEGRYCYTLSNLFKDAVGDDFTASSLQTMSINMYYYFQLGGYNK